MLKYNKIVDTKIGDKMRIEILLKKVRKQKHITLVQLSDKTGISTTHINDIENNLKEPSFSMMIRLAKGLDVELSKLYKVIW